MPSVKDIKIKLDEKLAVRIKELETRLKGSEERNMILLNGKNKIVATRDQRIKELESVIKEYMFECGPTAKGFTIEDAVHHYIEFKQLLNKG